MVAYSTVLKYSNCNYWKAACHHAADRCLFVSFLPSFLARATNEKWQNDKMTKWQTKLAGGSVLSECECEVGVGVDSHLCESCMSQPAPINQCSANNISEGIVSEKRLTLSHKHPLISHLLRCCESLTTCELWVSEWGSRAACPSEGCCLKLPHSLTHLLTHSVWLSDWVTQVQLQSPLLCLLFHWDSRN